MLSFICQRKHEWYCNTMELLVVCCCPAVHCWICNNNCACCERRCQCCCNSLQLLDWCSLVFAFISLLMKMAVQSQPCLITCAAPWYILLLSVHKNIGTIEMEAFLLFVALSSPFSYCLLVSNKNIDAIVGHCKSSSFAALWIILLLVPPNYQYNCDALQFLIAWHSRFVTK